MQLKIMMPIIVSLKSILGGIFMLRRSEKSCELYSVMKMVVATAARVHKAIIPRLVRPGSGAQVTVPRMQRTVR